MAETPSDLAFQAAEAIRTMNHQTRDGQGLEYPSDVYTVVANVKTLSERLPQLLGQLSAWLQAEYQAGRVRHDSGGDPELNVAAVEMHLSDAADAARVLRDALDGAHNELSGLAAL